MKQQRKVPKEITVLEFINLCSKQNYKTISEYLKETKKNSTDYEDFQDRIENIINLIEEAKEEGEYYFIGDVKKFI